MRSSVLRFSRRLFLAAGLIMLAYAGGTVAYADLYQRYQSWKFEQEIAAPKAAKAPVVQEAADLREGDLVGKLDIPRIGISVMAPMRSMPLPSENPRA